MPQAHKNHEAREPREEIEYESSAWKLGLGLFLVVCLILWGISHLVEPFPRR